MVGVAIVEGIAHRSCKQKNRLEHACLNADIGIKAEVSLCVKSIGKTDSSLKLDQIDLAEIRWCTRVDTTSLRVKPLSHVADPKVRAEFTHAMDFIVANTQLVARQPNDRAAGT
jgi:hypothetical protein